MTARSETVGRAIVWAGRKGTEENKRIEEAGTVRELPTGRNDNSKHDPCFTMALSF